MKWPWQHRVAERASDTDEAAVAYVQEGVMAAVSDLTRSLSVFDRTFKAAVNQPEQKVHAHV